MRFIHITLLAASVAAYSIPSRTNPSTSEPSSRWGGVRAQNGTATPAAEYDYIIVGGGIGGMTLANLLSESGENEVLVLEAGELDPNEDFITTPGLAGTGSGTQYDWNITTVASPLTNNREMTLPAGRADVPLSAANLTSNETCAAEMAQLYQNERTGPMASPGAEFLLFLPLSNLTDRAAELQSSAQSQDVASFVSDAPATVQAGFALQHRLITETLNSASSTPLEILWNDGAVVLGLQHPLSRGSVKVANNDPFTPALVLVQGVKFARTIMATEAMVDILTFELAPGLNVTSNADIESYIRENVATFSHYSGTTMMAPLDVGGVVDTSFRVHGVESLRIVDAGVIPLVPAAHTSTTVYALAERAAVMMQL